MEKWSTEMREMESKYKSLLDSTLNTRDLGGYLKDNGGYTKEYSILRSDAVLAPSDRDIDFLIKNRIHTIIDMRVQKDVSEKPSPFEKMSAFDYYNIPMEEGSKIPKSVSDVPYSYMRIAEAENLTEIFRLISRAEDGVLYHCTAGKDRSGVVSAILLMLTEVNREEIIDDYMITKVCNESKRKEIALNHPGLDMNIVIANEAYIGGFLEMFCKKYGNAEDYFHKKGLTSVEIDRLKEKL